jgi:hypothetical protein
VGVYNPNCKRGRVTHNDFLSRFLLSSMTMVMRESVVYIPEHVLERSWEMEIVTEAMTTTVVITLIPIAVIHGQKSDIEIVLYDVRSRE